MLTIWRQQRANRVGRALAVSGIFLASIATIADLFWSDISVVATDIILLLGCAVSAHWLNREDRPKYFWWPAFGTFWISSLPSFWTTGGLDSPFFGLGLCALYVIGAVMEPEGRSPYYFLFALAHIPVFFVIEKIHPLSTSPNIPILFTSIITALLLCAVYVCLEAMLRTENELSLEFSEHYENIKKAESDLKQREAQLREAQSIANVGSWEWDLRADRISWSDELFKIYDVDPKTFDHSFEAYLDRLNPQMREKIESIIQESVSTGRDFSFENTISTSRGKRDIFSRGRAVRDDSGRVVKMLGTTQDITDRKRIESELTTARGELEARVEERTQQLAQSLEREKAAKEIAENASLAKMQFLANMSHEIRTPMNSILGFTELLKEEGHSTDQFNDYLARIRDNGSQLLHLIDDILDLSKFEAGNIPIRKSNFALKTLIGNIVDSFLPAIKNKGIHLELKFAKDITDSVFTDSNRISQILTNLLSNAIKFSEKGEIQIEVATKTMSDGLHFIFDIEDTGLGISLENQQKLFQPFSQGDSSVGRKFGGSGLGLALSKRIAEALGGDLKLQKSVPGMGSHFRLDIPINPAKENVVETPVPEEKHIEEPNLRGKTILLVEDSPDNAFLISHFLKTLGVQIDLASDGLQAVEATKKKTYDCILMDIQMPGMDGLEATRTIRKNGFQNPIIALTAHALAKEAERSFQAGCNVHLTKPISRKELIQTLSEQIRSPLEASL